MYDVNPMQLIQMIRQGRNPQQLLMSILEQDSGNNRISANLLTLARKNDGKGIEQFARNFFQSQGMDFDKEFMAFRQQLGL